MMKITQIKLDHCTDVETREDTEMSAVLVTSCTVLAATHKPAMLVSKDTDCLVLVLHDVDGYIFRIEMDADELDRLCTHAQKANIFGQTKPFEVEVPF